MDLPEVILAAESCSFLAYLLQSLLMLDINCVLYLLAEKPSRHGTHTDSNSDSSSDGHFDC